jgi:hypothetical protein
MFRVASSRVELKPFPCRAVGSQARKSDQGAIRVGLACNSTFREMHRDITFDVLPAAHRLVGLGHRGSERGCGGGRGGKGEAACQARRLHFLAYGVVSIASAPQPASSSDGMLASHAVCS